MKHVLLTLMGSLFVLSTFAQVEQFPTKTKCLEGDCVNGTGKLQLKFKEPGKNSRLSHRIYAGKFTNGKLNGEGEMIFVGEDKSTFTLKGNFEEGVLSTYDSLTFITEKYTGKAIVIGMDGMFGKPGEGAKLKGTFKPKSETEFNKFTVVDLNIKSFNGYFDLMPIAGDNLFVDYTKPCSYIFMTGLTVIQTDDRNGSDKIIFPKRGDVFPCNGYVHDNSIGFRDNLKLQNLKTCKIKTLELLPNNATRTGEYNIFSWDLCKKNGDFIVKKADGTQVTETYKDNVLISTK